MPIITQLFLFKTDSKSLTVSGGKYSDWGDISGHGTETLVERPELLCLVISLGLNSSFVSFIVFFAFLPILQLHYSYKLSPYT